MYLKLMAEKLGLPLDDLNFIQQIATVTFDNFEQKEFIQLRKNIEDIQEIAEAEKHEFYIEEFDLSEYGADRFRNFIEDLMFTKESNGPMDSASAMMFALAVAEGVRDWNEFKNDYLKPYYLIQEICAKVVDALNMWQATPAEIEHIVFRVIESCNGRMPLIIKNNIPVKYDPETKKLGGLFAKLRRGDWSKDATLANCKPLTEIIYLAMSSIGIKTNIHLASGAIEDHTYSGSGTMSSSSGREIIFENTRVENINQTMPLFNNVSTDNLWNLIADTFVATIPVVGRKEEEPLTSNNLENTERNIKTLEQIKELTSRKTGVYTRLIAEYYSIKKTVYKNPEYLKNVLIALSENMYAYYSGYLETKKNYPNYAGMLQGIEENLWIFLNQFLDFSWEYALSQLCLTEEKTKQLKNTLTELKNLFVFEDRFKLEALESVLDSL